MKKKCTESGAGWRSSANPFDPFSGCAARCVYKGFTKGSSELIYVAFENKVYSAPQD